MSTKEIALKSIQELPDAATWLDIEERIRFIAGVEQGLEDIQQGRTHSHEDVLNLVETWLTE
jgi:predicted transcriptional regulator